MIIANAFIFTAIIASGPSKAFVDQRLEAWTSSSLKNSLVEDERRVIVYFKGPGYTNRSQLMKSNAIAAEREDMKDYLHNQARKFPSSSRNSNLIEASDVRILWSSQAIATSISRGQLNQLSHDPEIDGIIENVVITLDQPTMPKTPNKTDESVMTYGLQRINAKAAWDDGITGEGVKIGVIDTGVDQNHPDLVGKILLQKDFTSEKDNIDHNGHGTHVSGTIVGGNASGRAIGVAPGAKIIMAKVLDKSGSGYTEDLLAAMEWMIDPDGNPATNDAPRVVSNSWVANSQWFYGFRNVVRSWRRFEIFPNFAAGNSGFYFTVGAPASYPFAYAVGSVDENNSISSFSSRGPSIIFGDYYIPSFVTKPEISAPGSNVFSSIPKNKKGETYAYFSGTSMATPHIAGVLALALQSNPELKLEELEELLNSSVLPKSKKKSNRYGNGIVQVDRVVTKAKLWPIKPTALYFQDKDPSLWAWDTP